MSRATEDSAQFGRLYSALLIVNAIGLVGLTGLIGWNLTWLIGQVSRRRPGGRLTARMVATFSLLAVTPVVIVFVFSLRFLDRGIDSWFDVRVARALEDALELGKLSLDAQMRNRFRQVERMSAELASISPDGYAGWLTESQSRSGASELTLVSSSGSALAASTDATSLVPHRPDETVLLQLKQTHRYIGLDPIGQSGLFIRVAVELPADLRGEKRYLQALFPVAERMNELAAGVQQAFAKYRELSYLREPLKTTFILTLSLVLAFSLLSAVWAAFFFARRMVAPLRSLSSAIRAVAAGDYEGRLPEGGSDELGFLVESYNDMTRRLGAARDETRQSQAQVEAQRTYLEAVLLRLSSGVLTTDREGRLFTANKMAGQLLGAELEAALGQPLARLASNHPHVAPLLRVLEAHTEDTTEDWREEVVLLGPHGRQVLMCRGTPLEEAGPRGAHPETPLAEGRVGQGQLLVFDDVTNLIEAERNQAWSEVARRLAHEIKNPLTPIQLSAERLRHK